MLAKCTVFQSQGGGPAHVSILAGHLADPVDRARALQLHDHHHHFSPVCTFSLCAHAPSDQKRSFGSRHTAAHPHGRHTTSYSCGRGHVPVHVRAHGLCLALDLCPHVYLIEREADRQYCCVAPWPAHVTSRTRVAIWRTWTCPTCPTCRIFPEQSLCRSHQGLSQTSCRESCLRRTLCCGGLASP